MMPLISFGLDLMNLSLNTSTSAIRPGASFDEYTTWNFLPPPWLTICDRLGSYVTPTSICPDAIAAGTDSGVIATDVMSLSVRPWVFNAYDSRKSDGDNGLKPIFLPLNSLILLMLL